MFLFYISFMYRTSKQIIDNQERYKNEILNYFLSEIKSVRKELNDIKTDDEFINQEKEKLIKKLKKVNTVNSIKKYFYLSNKRDENFYAWWDDAQQEALILPYGKK